MIDMSCLVLYTLQSIIAIPGKQEFTAGSSPFFMVFDSKLLRPSGKTKKQSLLTPLSKKVLAEAKKGSVCISKVLQNNNCIHDRGGRQQTWGGALVVVVVINTDSYN